MSRRAPNFKPEADAIIVHRLVEELSVSGLSTKGKFRSEVWDNIILELRHKGYEYNVTSVKGRFDRVRLCVISDESPIDFMLYDSSAGGL